MTWLYIPSASVRDSAESNEDLNLRHLERLSQFCTASGKSAQPRSLRKRLKEAIYQPLRSGLTLRPSQAAQLLDTWIRSESIASRAAIHANRSQSLANDLAKTMRGIYGLPSLKRLSDMHQRCCSSRMSEGILFSDFRKSANVWNDWVTGLRQACSQRLKLVQDTDASDCLSWPTAAARDHKGLTLNRNRTSGALDEAAKQMWATPQSFDATDIQKDPNGKRLKKGGCKTLADDICHRFHQADQATTGETSHTSGTSSCQLWPTPTANDDNKSPEAHLAMKSRMPGGTRKAITSLNVLTKIWATPAATNATNTRNRTNRTNRGGNDGETLCDQVHPKRLNPLFVAWLMGYLEPINCGPMETQSFHIVRQWLSSVCGQHYEEATNE